MGIVEKIKETKDLGCTEEQIKEAENTEVNPVLKTHLDDGDELVWYKDPTIVATWHSNGKLDVPCFDATDVTISAVNFRILKGHWRTKTEHSIGTESNHWLFNGRPVSEYLELYPDFWKSNETKTVQSKKARQPRQPRQKKETTDKTTSVINSEHEYKYESEKLLYGSSFSGLYPDKLKKQATPSWVAEDMVELLPDEVWRTDSKFLDIYCKSGIFLEIIINKLMEKVDYSVIGLYEPREIYKYIIENQIYAVCWNKEYLDLSRRVINGKASKEVNIHCIGPEIEYMDEIKAEAILKNDRAQGSIDKAILGIDIRKEFFNNMQLDVVIGNPPYNNDIYIPFVEMGHSIASTCSVFITPAKWQAKGGKKNEQFRQNIVPYMSKIVYYPESSDVFDIAVQGGISYYLIDNSIHENKLISSYCSKRNILGSNLAFEERESTNVEKITFLSTKIQNIIDKINTKNTLYCTKVGTDGHYNVMFTDLYNESKGQFLDKDGTAKVLLKVYYKNNTEKDAGATVIINSFNSEDKAKSFCSYLDTKFIRFMLLIGKCSFHASNTACWRFVPDPITFDHIFTDEELYKKYNLTEEEINIIESVIKERK